MRNLRQAALILPALLLLTLICFVACPPAKPGQPAAAGQQAGELAKHGAQLAAGPPADPAPALDFISGALAAPTEDGQAPLGPVWNTIARLAGTPQASVLSPLRTELIAEARAAGATAPPQLVGAWLAVDKPAALAFVRAKFRDKQYTYIQALGQAPVLLRHELDRLDLARLPLDCAMLALELLRNTGVSSADAGLLQELARHRAAQIRLRAIGYLAALGKATPAQRQLLVSSSSSTDQTTYIAALEGIKCSQAARHAADLVPLVAHAAMGDEDPDAPKDPQVLYAAYALAYLPGDQAALMRGNLLGARDPQVRWQARLGELLHGQPGYWDDALDVFGAADKDMWIALQPPEACAPPLLNTYRLASIAEDIAARRQAAQHLARFTGDNSSVEVIELLAKLAADPEPEVAAAALESGARLKARELAPLAEAALADEHMPWETRLAAAGLILAVAPAKLTAEEQAE